MTITTEWTGQESWGVFEGSVTVVLDYDSAAKNVGVSVTPTGDGAGVPVSIGIDDLTSTPPTPIVGKCDLSQFGLPNDGTRHVIDGPGASGTYTDVDGTNPKPLPTANVSQSLFRNGPQSASPTWAPRIYIATPTSQAAHP